MSELAKELIRRAREFLDAPAKDLGHPQIDADLYWKADREQLAEAKKLLAEMVDALEYATGGKATHAHGCWKWGWRHYECALREIGRLKRPLANIPHRFSVRPMTAEEGGGYLVEFPDLPGCITEGDTLEEAIRNAEDAMRCWLDAKEGG